MSLARQMNVLAAVEARGPLRPLSPVAERLRRQALDLAAAEGLGRGSFAFRILPLEQPAGENLHVDGERLQAPWLIPATGTLTALACGVCTLGAVLERRVRELFDQGRRSLGMALDSLGNEMLFEVSRRMHHRMLKETARQGLSMAGELHSGDPGLALESQPAVLRLARAEAVGVSASAGAVMHPLKSTSAIFGVGLDLPAVKWSRCDGCKSAPNCGFFRQATAA